MTDKRPSSAKLRRSCFEAHKWADGSGKIWLTCHLCQGRIDPAREAWEAEHVIRRVLSGDDGAGNLRPAHVACHRTKTNADVSEHAKGKRASDKHFGIVRRGWGGRFRKKLNGEVVER